MTIHRLNNHLLAKTRRSRFYLRGFSLVEVTLALGICSVCLVTVIGLMPVGINTNHNSLEQTAAAAVAREVVGDLWGVSSTAVATAVTQGTKMQTQRYQIPLPGTTTAASTVPADTLFLAENGTISNSAATARYRVDIAYGASTSVNQPAAVLVVVTWPGACKHSTGRWTT